MSEPTFTDYDFSYEDVRSVVGKPDHLTALHPLGGHDSNHPFAFILCANQCMRDKQHPCMVAVAADKLHNTTWIDDVTHYSGWVVIIWGRHQHTLPFCCVRCMIEFINERMVAQGEPAIAMADSDE